MIAYTVEKNLYKTVKKDYQMLRCKYY